jgi:hypothetical protein
VDAATLKAKHAQRLDPQLVAAAAQPASVPAMNFETVRHLRFTLRAVPEQSPLL